MKIPELCSHCVGSCMALEEELYSSCVGDTQELYQVRLRIVQELCQGWKGVAELCRIWLRVVQESYTVISELHESCFGTGVVQGLHGRCVAIMSGWYQSSVG